MTYDEALAILGPDVVARMNERLGPPAPLSEEQVTFLVPVLGDIEGQFIVAGRPG